MVAHSKSEPETLSPSPPLLSTREAAAYLGIAMKTLDRWASLGVGPRYYKLEKHRRYTQEDIQAWLEARSHEQEGGAAR